MQQVSAQDAQFIYMESENNLAHVTSVSIYDPSTAPGGKVRFKDIIAHVEDRQHVSPLFKRRLVHVPFEWDYPYWVEDEHYDIEYHIRHGALPAPGDWRQFCIHLARYHSRPLDMKRPPWEMYVIEGLDKVKGLPKGCYAIATKIHHVAVDGHSILKFFQAMSDSDAKGTPMLDLSAFKEQAPETPSLTTMMMRSAANNMRSPMRLTETLLRSVPALYSGLQNTLGEKDSEKKSSTVPDTRFNQSVSPHKMVDARDFALADLKKIRSLVPGSTVNDVVLAICAGALRQYLKRHKELPADSLVAWVPINRRSKDAADQDAPGNNITAMTASIHTDIADPLSRLEAIYQTTQASKEARSGISARLMTDITRHMPAATQVMASRLVLRTGVASRMCNLFVSNVPGPTQEMYMNGARVLRSMGMAPLSDGMGLFIATPSYNGRMNFTVTSTREILPDIEFFMTCLESSMQELKALLPVTSNTRKRSSAKKTPQKNTARRKKPAAKRQKESA